jgi:hypothetical protein
MIMVKRIIADLRAGLVVKKDNPLKIYERDEIDQEPLGYDGLDPKLENDDIPF